MIQFTLISPQFLPTAATRLIRRTIALLLPTGLSISYHNGARIRDLVVCISW